MYSETWNVKGVDVLVLIKQHFQCFPLCASVIIQESSAVEHNDQPRLEKLREELESEHQSRCEDLEKKYAYKMEQLRQEFADKREQVILQLITTTTTLFFSFLLLLFFILSCYAYFSLQCFDAVDWATGRASGP